MPPIEAVLVGAGERGRLTAGAHALKFPEQLKFVAVAEPNADKRAAFARDHNIPPKRCFRSYEDLLSREQLAPLCFNLTMDKIHLPSAIPILEKGYELFLEKPMAHTPEGCLQIAQTAQKLGRMVQICHPLRYTAFYRRVKDILESGAIGRILSLSMTENVAYWHFGHSFVRGNWGQLSKSGPFILTKCCHDMDIATWLADSQVRSVASFGSLTYFRPENAPPGAPKRCLDGCPEEKRCPFHAPSQYLTPYTDWPVSAISLDKSLEARRKALETGPYGLCIFHTGNDIVDHQTVGAVFETDATLDFTVNANSYEPFRTVRIVGTEGEINGHCEKAEIRVSRFRQGVWPPHEPVIHNPKPQDGGHLGGDTGAISNFLRCYREKDYAFIQRSLEIAVEGHLLAFAAEKARASGKIISMKSFRKDLTKTLV